MRRILKDVTLQCNRCRFRWGQSHEVIRECEAMIDNAKLAELQIS